MGRQLRPYMPGAFFHIYARTQSRVHWFADDVKDGIVRIIADSVERSDIMLHSVVVMENHFHLALRQGDAPLAAFMHPVMRGIALLAKNRYGLDDHLFGSRYQSRMCVDARDLRNVIRYIHRNPVEAGCCANPADYPWSSHAIYATSIDPSKLLPRVHPLTRLFARSYFRSPSELQRDYLAFVQDEQAQAGDGFRNYGAGDNYGLELFRAFRARVPKEPLRRKDLRDIVRDGIRDLCPELDLEIVRSFRGIRFTRIRHDLVRRAAAGGHSGCAIARYLNISESQVSRVLRTLPKSRMRCE